MVKYILVLQKRRTEYAVYALTAGFELLMTVDHILPANFYDGHALYSNYNSCQVIYIFSFTVSDKNKILRYNFLKLFFNNIFDVFAQPAYNQIHMFH